MRLPVFLALVTSAFVLTALGVARAEKANLGPDQLREIATHVITGRVAAIYERSSREGR